MAWVRGEGRESNKATNIYEIGRKNMKRTNRHMHDCTRMETINGYNHCATKPVHRRPVDNVMKHKTHLLDTGSTKLQENNATTLELPLNYRKNESNTYYTNENLMIVVIRETQRCNKASNLSLVYKALPYMGMGALFRQ